MSAAAVELTAGPWQLATDPDGPWSPATVPGNWYLDGVDGADTVWYRCAVEVPDTGFPHGLEVVVRGVDYRATVSWDGEVIGAHTGGFAPFTVVAAGSPGTHELTIRVDCPVEPYGSVWPHSKTTLRGVMGHHDARPGGWSERGQERSTGGLWGGVQVCARTPVAIEGLGVATPLRGADADLRLTARVRVSLPEPVRATVRATLTEDEGDGPVAYVVWSETFIDPGTAEVEVSGPLPAPRLWWTWDHGEPHRYRLDVEVLVEGDVVASEDRLVGVRDVEVGEDWIWRLNGRPVFIRGMNYIGEQWLSALTPQRASGDVALAVAANLNLLRVHAHVSTPAFYDACDAAGVLVWQDLPMQWGYADTAETYRVARTMVAELVALHGWRPSVAYWCAHNEAPWNEPWMADEAGRFVPDQNQQLDAELRDLFRRLDPSRPALANSGAGDGHTYPGWYWGTWRVASEIPGGAFVTEYGAQACPDVAVLREFLPEGASADDWSFHGFQHHENNKHAGVNLLAHPVEEIVAVTQRYQARQLQFATEHYRRRKRERVHGVVPFMLVDPWLCISWSVLDHQRNPKPGYHALARAMQPLLPSIEAATDSYPGDDPFEPEPVVFGIWWINDEHRTHPGAELSWWLVDDAGERLDGGAATVDVLADTARRVLQAGPFDLPTGRYGIESRLAAADGTTLGHNRWDFEVVEGPDLDLGVADDTPPEGGSPT